MFRKKPGQKFNNYYRKQMLIEKKNTTHRV
jgi:hypothetical protein